MIINLQLDSKPSIHGTERRANNLILELESLSQVTGEGPYINDLALLNEVLRSASGLATAVKTDFSNPLGRGVMAESLREMRENRKGLKVELDKIHEQVERGRALIKESRDKSDKQKVNFDKPKG